MTEQLEMIMRYAAAGVETRISTLSEEPGTVDLTYEWPEEPTVFGGPDPVPGADAETSVPIPPQDVCLTELVVELRDIVSATNIQAVFGFGGGTDASGIERQAASQGQIQFLSATVTNGTCIIPLGNIRVQRVTNEADTPLSAHFFLRTNGGTATIRRAILHWVGYIPVAGPLRFKGW